MKKALSCSVFLLLLCLLFASASVFAASTVPDVLYDFSEKNSTCYWITNLPGSYLKGDAWIGTTDKVNNIIQLAKGSSLRAGKDYPYFVLRVKYDMPENATGTPNSYTYIQTVDADGKTLTGLYSGKVSMNKNMALADNGKYVTYIYDFSSNEDLAAGYIGEIAVGVGNGFTNGGVTVSLDFAALLPDPDMTVTFADAASDTGATLPDAASVKIGSSLDLSGYSARKKDNRFLGWTTTPDSTSVITNLDCVKQDTTLYAVWESAETVDITYHTSQTESISVPMLVGDRLYSAQTPTREDGLIFYGWSATPDSSEVLAYTAKASQSADYYAVWGEGYAWNFDTDGSLQGVTTEQLGSVSVSGGSLRATSTGNDPKLYLNVSDAFGKYNTLILQGSATSSFGSAQLGYQVFPRLDNASYSASRCVQRAMSGQNVLQELRYSLYSELTNGEQYKTLRTLRIDPGSETGIEVCIERIFLIPDVKAAALFDCADGSGHLPRLVPDETGKVVLPESTFTHSYKKFEAWTDGTNSYAPGSTVALSSFVTFTPVWDEGAVKNLDTEYYPGFTKKALIFSYDDGNPYWDGLLIRRLNKYGFKGSFNVNPGLWGSMSEEEIANLRSTYAGHEIANHSDTHPNMNEKDENGAYKLSEESCIDNIARAKTSLKTIFDTDVVGFAWPYGMTNGRQGILSHVRSSYLYVRNSGYTHSFDIPDSFTDDWNFTVYQNSAKGVYTEYAEKYKALDRNTLSLYSVWGHATEFDKAISLDDFDAFLALCNTIDLWNPTCADYVRYIQARKKLVATYDAGLYNPTDVTLYAKSGNTELTLLPGSRYDGTTYYNNNATVHEDTIQITANLDTRSASGNTATGVVASFDAKGQLLRYCTTSLAADTIATLRLSLPADAAAAYVKVFAFDDLQALSPLCQELRLTLTQE